MSDYPLSRHVPESNPDPPEPGLTLLESYEEGDGADFDLSMWFDMPGNETAVRQFIEDAMLWAYGRGQNDVLADVDMEGALAGAPEPEETDGNLS